MWMIRFTNGGIPYYKGRTSGGLVYATDTPDMALQYLTKDEAAAKLPIKGIDGGVIPAEVAPVPRWAWAI